MCKTDKDCMRGQTCTSGVCTGTAAEELADAEPAPSKEETKEEPACDP